MAAVRLGFTGKTWNEKACRSMANYFCIHTDLKGSISKKRRVQI